MRDVQIRFFDSIVSPWRELDALFSEHPLAANPDSNVLIFKAQSLVVALNHFREKNPTSPVSSVQISDDLRNFANSIKHEKGAETDVTGYLTLQYECCGGKFRFIRNEIVCKYERAQGLNKCRQFSATNEIWNTLERYAQALAVDILRFSPAESRYEFLPVAVAFTKPAYAAETSSARFSMFKKIGDSYELFDPPAVKFVVLDEAVIGSSLSEMSWNFVELSD